MPLLGPSMEDRNRVFQRLKPPCVALSQAALALNGPSANTKTVTGRLEDLTRELSAVTKDASSLDEKLADYVFFPLSQVLKASQKVSIRCLELTFQCLAILIEKGWRSRIQPPLAAQVVILCTMMSESKPKGLAFAESTDELQASALSCLLHLFEVLNSSSEATKALTSDAHVPQLGQTITTILDTIMDGTSAEVQTTATTALMSLTKNVATRDVKAMFLPGIVSKLTKVLIPQTKQRRNHAVLVGALDILQLLFSDALGDVSAGTPTHAAENDSKSESSEVIDEKWLENAAAQLKPAIASIVKLRDNSRHDVRSALARFCFSLLKQCRKTLANCMSLALETLLLLSSKQGDESIRFSLEALAHSDQSIAALIQSTLFDWLQSVLTQMQGADEQAKVERLQQITTAYGVAVASGIDTSALDRTLANVLRDSVVITIQVPRSAHQHTAVVSPIQSFDLASLDRDRGNTEFSSVLVRQRGQQEVIEAIEALTRATVITSPTSTVLTATLARSLRQSHGETQLASFWLLLNAAETSFDERHEVDRFLLTENMQPAAYQEHLEDIYAFSLGVLTDTPDEPIDWRLQALSLRALALRARLIGEEFRFELIDALYPILHTLATPHDTLQQDSIATLNIFTTACGYHSVKDLIVDNVDYLTNAVALKLNAFDVSPQAPQVLLMMVRLAGPSLLPYLEDTIESIFAALRDYHGYPLLVELLFKVLSVVAEEGTKAPQLAIADEKAKELLDSRLDMWRPMSIDGLIDLLADRRTEESQAATGTLEPHPQRPWKDDAAKDGEDDPSDEEQPPLDVEVPPPAPKAYALLLKISELTQHFLPSASASLRSSLLTLIKTTMPAIARHENSFLPLINTLWPEVVSRLDDTEPSVVAGALDIVAMLCESAGDFMRSRMLQLWPGLVDIHQRTAKDIVQTTLPTVDAGRKVLKVESADHRAIGPTSSRLKQAVTRMQSTPADYSDTSTRMVWESLVSAITAAVQHVQLSPDHFDEALEMLDPVLEEPNVREAFEMDNADAVWLSRIRSGVLNIPEMPDMGVKTGWRFVAVAG